MNDINKLALSIRKRILELAYATGKTGAHIGGSLSVVEIFSTLYSSVLKRDTNCLENRDRLIVSKGHCALALYSVLQHVGILTKEETDTFEKNGSPFYAHALRNIDKGIEFSGGSLGLGISYAVGVALACKKRGIDNHVYVLLGDGECNEGQVWEALMSISNFHLNNMTVIVDCNGLQSDGFTKDVMNVNSLAEKFKSFGFETEEVDGHSVLELLNVFAKKRDLPLAVVANTVKGKGVLFMENEKSWHHGSLTEKQYEQALEELY